jgi:hypothetical protein
MSACHDRTRRCHGTGYLFLYPDNINENNPYEVIPYIAKNRGELMIEERIYFFENHNLHRMNSKCCGVLCAYSVNKRINWNLGVAMQIHPSCVSILRVYPVRPDVSLNIMLPQHLQIPFHILLSK